jgi:ABC-type bacteriocin/lantibiotic exporter with double-glycine peptidase domain
VYAEAASPAAHGAGRLRLGALALGAACLLTAGCAGPARRGVESGPDRFVRVEGVPLVRQESPQGCGAAALAMVLARWGKPVPQEAIWAASPPPDGQGLRASALRDFARAQGLQAFVIEGRREDLDRELARGRPVIVGLVKRQGRRVYPHYEVVVGLDRARERILVLDPARGERERKLRDFSKEWDAAGRVTLAILPAPPPEAPAPRPAAAPVGP